MKNRFLKSVLVLSTVLTLVNCSEETADAINNTDPLANQPTDEPSNLLPADEPCWLLKADQQYLIYSAGIVTDINGNVVGTIVFTEGTLTGSIIAIDGTMILENVDAGTLPLVTRATAAATVTPASSAGTSTTPTPTPTLSSATDPQPVLSSGSQPTTPVVSSSSEKTAVSSSAETQQAQSSSSEKQPQNVGSITVTGSLTQTVSKNSAISKVVLSGVDSDPERNWKLHFLNGKLDKDAKTYTIEGTVPDYWNEASATEEFKFGSETIKLTLNLGGSSTVKSSSSQQQQAKSSSSQQQQRSSSSAKSSSSQQVKSSSSSAKSSSSTQTTNPNASAEEAKYLNAGAGGQQGFATRYWDCCMPHCAWPEHGGKAKTCDAKGKNPISNNNGSICSGGQGTTCTSQTPIIVSEKLAYAFAATPGNDNTCGKCFALTFTGQGKYETKANHQALKGKTLVVMASNIGYDVQGGQFDVMIPGGGVGAFNGCANMGWGDQGAQYGGLLSKCEDEVGYDGDLLTKRKQCLTEKCNKSFANDTEAKEGCLFLATWMEAAGNPLHTYKEVDCPQALIQKF